MGMYMTPLQLLSFACGTALVLAMSFVVRSFTNLSIGSVSFHLVHALLSLFIATLAEFLLRRHLGIRTVVNISRNSRLRQLFVNLAIWAILCGLVVGAGLPTPATFRSSVLYLAVMYLGMSALVSLFRSIITEEQI